MKIGLMIYGRLDQMTGGYIYDQYLVSHLRCRGHCVVLISLANKSYAKCLGAGVPKYLKDALLDEHLDLLIQDELCHPSLILFNRWWKRNTQIPIVSLVHLLRQHEFLESKWRRIYRFAEAEYLKTVDAFIYVSNTTKREVESNLLVSRPYVVAMPGKDRPGPGLPLQDIRTRLGKKRLLRLISVGNVVPRKRLIHLIKSLSLVPNPHFELFVCGSLDMDPGYVEKVKKLIRSIGWERKVHLLGALPAVELSREFAKADVFLLPSLYEGLSISYLEGLGYGLPIFASTNGAAKEVISHQREGFLINPRMTSELAPFLDRLIAAPEKLEQMSLASRKKFDELPSWQETCSTIAKFVENYSKELPASEGSRS